MVGEPDTENADHRMLFGDWIYISFSINIILWLFVAHWLPNNMDAKFKAVQSPSC